MTQTSCIIGWSSETGAATGFSASRLMCRVSSTHCRLPTIQWAQRPQPLQCLVCLNSKVMDSLGEPGSSRKTSRQGTEYTTAWNLVKMYSTRSQLHINYKVLNKIFNYTRGWILFLIPHGAHNIWKCSQTSCDIKCMQTNVVTHVGKIYKENKQGFFPATATSL